MIKATLTGAPVALFLLWLGAVRTRSCLFA
jgi:hypothetical protein